MFFDITYKSKIIIESEDNDEQNKNKKEKK